MILFCTRTSINGSRFANGRDTVFLSPNRLHAIELVGAIAILGATFFWSVTRRSSMDLRNSFAILALVSEDTDRGSV